MLYFPTGSVVFEQVNAGGLYYIKPDTTQLDFDVQFVNLPHFRNHKVLYYDYLTFGTKITICFLGDIRIQSKRINKKP